MRYKNITLKLNGKNYKQVNKTLAEKLFMSGRTIFLHPSNMIFDNVWQKPCEMKFNADEANYYETCSQFNYFDAVVNDFSYYNCDSERGRRVNYFVEC